MESFQEPSGPFCLSVFDDTVFSDPILFPKQSLPKKTSSEPREERGATHSCPSAGGAMGLASGFPNQI